jgi:hypothetical protein
VPKKGTETVEKPYVVGDKVLVKLWRTFGGRYRQGNPGKDGWSAAASFF